MRIRRWSPSSGRAARVAWLLLGTVMLLEVERTVCCGETAKEAPKKGPPALLYCTNNWDARVEKALKAEGFNVATEPFVNWRWDFMRQFNAILLAGPRAIPELPTGGEKDPVTPELRANLRRYVEEGGALILGPEGYWATDVWLGRWSSIFAPLFGMEWISEYACDPQHTLRDPAGSGWTGSVVWTENFKPDHPITKGIRRASYYQIAWSDGGSPRPLWKELAGWETLARGMESSVSYPENEDGFHRRDKVGPATYKSAPPLLSVKRCGKGYVALDSMITVPGNAEKLMREAGVAPALDDAVQLAVNTICWLAEASKDSAVIGGYEPPKAVIKPLRPGQQNQTPWHWYKDARLPSTERQATKVLLGAHSGLSDGQGTPEELIAAARQAGYGALCFTEAMALMTQEKYEKLQAACRAASGKDFVALPGVQWEDEGGHEYLMVDIPKWPARWVDPNTKRMTSKWDVWFMNGMYPSFPLWLRSKESHPHPWFYAHISGLPVYSYKSNKLVENNEEWFLYLNEDRMFQNPVCPRLVCSPAEVLAGASEGYQTYVMGPPDSVREALTCSMRNPRTCFVSSGPLLKRFTSVGREAFDNRQADRWWWAFTVESPRPLKQVWVRDRERVEYALAGQGKKQFEFAFTGYHGKNHSFIPMAEDEGGGRLISPAGTTFGNINMIWQSCSDQQNFLGHPGLFFKGQYSWIYVPMGVSTWTSFASLGRPVGAPADGHVPGADHWIGADAAIGQDAPGNPVHYFAVRFHGGVVGNDFVRNDMTLDLIRSGEIGHHFIYQPRTDSVAEMRLFLFRPPITWPRNVWNYNAPASYLNPESKASATLVEGTVTATKDISLDAKRSLDVGFIAAGNGYNPTWQKQDGYSVMHSGLDGSVALWTASAKGGRLEGQVRKGGFVYVLPVHTGSLGFYPVDGDMAFLFTHDGKYNWTLRLGMKSPERQVKAGTKFSRRVAIARTDQGYAQEQAKACLDNVKREFGIGEAAPSFKIIPVVGTIKGHQFLQELEAHDGAFRCSLHAPILTWPCIPIAIRGLNDNWDTVVWGDYGEGLRRIPVRDGVGYASIDPIRASGREVWIGHPVTCNQPQARLLVLENGPAVCEVQVHNPTDAAMTVRFRSSPSANSLGIVPEFMRKLRVPAHGIERVRIQEGPVPAPPYQDVHYAIDHVMDSGRVVQDLDATWLEAVRSADKPGLMVSAAGQLRGDWVAYAPIGVDEPAGPMEMVARMKLIGGAKEDRPVGRLVAVCGDGPAGAGDDAGRFLANERVIAAREVPLSEFAAPDVYQEIPLSFDRPREGWMGYRIEWLGGAYVNVDSIALRQPEPNPPVTPLPSRLPR